MNLAPSTTDSTKACPYCGGGPLVPKTGPARLCSYRGESGYLVPEGLAVPTCGKCGSMVPGSTQLDVLGKEFDRQREDRRRSTDGSGPAARASSASAPQVVMPVALPLTDIVADYEWNARSGDYRTSDCDADEGRGTVGLADSMQERGQDVPVSVRPHPSSRGRFLLVCGFRRHAAAEMLAARGAEIKGLPRAHLLCLVRALSDADARMLNIAENSNRDNLKPADFAYAIADALRLGKTLDDIVLQSGKCKSYVSNLSKIGNPRLFDKQLFERWRKEGWPLTVDNIHIQIFGKNVPLHKQAEAVQAILASKARKRKEGGGRGGWKAAAERTVKELGWYLGRLVRKGTLPSSAASLDWREAVEECLGLAAKRNATLEEIVAFAKTAEQACQAAQDGKDSPWSDREESYNAERDKTRRQRVRKTEGESTNAEAAKDYLEKHGVEVEGLEDGA